MKFKTITVKEFVEGNYFENENKNEPVSFTIDQFEGFGNETEPTNETINETRNENHSKNETRNETEFKNEQHIGNEPNGKNELEMNRKNEPEMND